MSTSDAAKVEDRLWSVNTGKYNTISFFLKAIYNHKRMYKSVTEFSYYFYIITLSNLLKTSSLLRNFTEPLTITTIVVFIFNYSMFVSPYQDI